MSSGILEAVKYLGCVQVAGVCDIGDLQMTCSFLEQ